MKNSNNGEYIIISWPESQNYMGQEGFEENSYLINDNRGLDDFGSSSYFVKKSWIDKINRTAETFSPARYILENENEFRLLEIEALGQVLEKWGNKDVGNLRTMPIYEYTYNFGTEEVGHNYYVAKFKDGFRPKIMMYDPDYNDAPIEATITRVGFQRYEPGEGKTLWGVLAEVYGLVAWKNKKKRRVIPENIPLHIIPLGQISRLAKRCGTILEYKILLDKK